MNVLRHKLWADLWQDKAGSWLAIASIAAGVFCVGTLFGMIDLQLSQMDESHRLSQPSHISLILRRDAEVTLLDKIKALPGVAGVDYMTQLSVRFRKPGGGDWQLGTLIVRPDYGGQHYDISSLEEGNWPDKGRIAVENLSASYAGIVIGDEFEFETNQGSSILKVNGIVRHPFVKPPKFGGQLHFFADAATAEAFGVPAESFRQLLVRVLEPYGEDRARKLASKIRLLLSQHGIAVNVTLLQDPERHWGRPFMAGINFVLQVMAVASLVLACVLIFNTVSAHVVRQTDQIGVMKALGARSITVAGLYLSETLLLAFLAIVLALPAALFAAHFSSCKVLSLFNVACDNYSYSERAVAYTVFGGLLMPLFAAIGPVVRGASMTVRVAIASYGLGGEFGRSRLDRMVEWFGMRFLPTIYAAALGNLFRRKARLLLTQSVLIVAGGAFLLLTSLVASLNLMLDREMAHSRYAVRLGFSTDQSAARIEDVLDDVDSSATFETWLRQPLELSKNGEQLRQKGSLGLQLMALPAQSRLYEPLIQHGRWFRAGDMGDKVLIIGADTAAANGIRPGDEVGLRIGSSWQTWKIIGLYRWLAGNGYAVEPVYAPLETVQALSGRADQASFALIAADVNNPADEADYLRRLRQAFEKQGVKLDAYTTQGKLEQRQFVRNQFDSVIGTLLGLAAMIAAVGGIGLSGTLAIGVLQRRREIGVLRAVGAPARAVFSLFLLEGLLHGVVAWLISVPLAYLAAEPIAKELGKILFGIALDFVFDFNAVFYWLGVVLLLAWGASYWPARKAARMTVRESLRY
ncbi:FtsX-like permease family protein [Methylomonas sp. MgM2]